MQGVYYKFLFYLKFVTLGNKFKLYEENEGGKTEEINSLLKYFYI